MVLIKQAPLPPMQTAAQLFTTSPAVQVIKVRENLQARETSQDWGEA